MRCTDIEGTAIRTMNVKSAGIYCVEFENPNRCDRNYLRAYISTDSLLRFDVGMLVNQFR